MTPSNLNIQTDAKTDGGLLGSLTLRLFLLLSVLFVFILLIVYVVIEWQGKPKVEAMTAQTVIETGNEAVNDLMADISRVDGIAIATTAMSAGLPKDDALFEQTVGNVMKQLDSQIVGGGVWFNPTTFDANLDRKSFVWERDATGTMVQTTKYDDDTQFEAPYYRDWWFIPTMYAEHNHCVWSKAYVDAESGNRVMTCAKAMYNAQNKQFDAVVSFDLLLDNLSDLMNSWQKRTGGYAFLVDMDNRFLTFPNLDTVTEVTELNPQGEKIQANKLAQQHPSFAPIATALDDINQTLIDDAKAISEGQHNLTAVSIMTTANYKRILEDEAQVLSALMMTTVDEQIDIKNDNFVTSVSIANDFVLGEPATAFVFKMPATHWKMVIVKPQRELLAVANTLSNQLLAFMFAGFGIAMLVAIVVFRRYLSLPLNRVAHAVATLSTLVDNKQYLDMPKHKLTKNSYSEINTINQSVNQLVDKVVENEGALAEVNVYLEKKVEERTAELQETMRELKASQVQLVQSEKMATLGQMVAGVAHEVNTPLGYVRGNLGLVSGNLSRFDELIGHVQALLEVHADVSATDEQKEHAYAEVLACCEEIRDDEVSEDLSELIKDSLYGVDQIAELVVSLRDFSRIDTAKVKEVNLNDCIENSLTMAKNNIKFMDINKQLGELPPIACNPSQINQILLNLFNNAAQAIETGNKGALHIASYATEENVVITVKDNGVGMPASVMDKIFEPFFTTKKAGEGTGLGLAISSQIMEQHHGSIDVESTPNVGTTFTLRFPKTQIDDTLPSDADSSEPVFTDAHDDAVFI